MTSENLKKLKDIVKNKSEETTPREVIVINPVKPEIVKVKTKKREIKSVEYNILGNVKKVTYK